MPKACKNIAGSEANPASAGERHCRNRREFRTPKDVQEFLVEEPHVKFDAGFPANVQEFLSRIDTAVVFCLATNVSL